MGVSLYPRRQQPLNLRADARRVGLCQQMSAQDAAPASDGKPAGGDVSQLMLAGLVGVTAYAVHYFPNGSWEWTIAVAASCALLYWVGAGRYTL